MINAISKLDHVNFTVSNFQESVSWYRDVFNFELVEKGVNQEGKRWGVLKSGDSMLAITEDRSRSLYRGDEFHLTYHFGLRLESTEEWNNKVEEYNLETFHSSPVRYPHSVSWYVKDPTGNQIEVSIWNDNIVRFPVKA